VAFWRDTTLPAHIDQHRLPEAREQVIPALVGDKSADFETPLFVPPHGLWVLRRAYLQTPTDLSADSSASWALVVVQRVEGRDRTLATFDGARYGLVADTPKRLPAHGSLDIALAEGWPVLLVGTKSGSPSSLDDLHLTLVVALG
jgi:hypothetical protein